MKHIAVIFAGGVGQRMTNATKPKQFLEVHGKPVLVYTLERFQNHPEIGGIVLVCVEGWMDYAEKLIRRYELHKVGAVIPGGANGHCSRFLGLRKAWECYGESIVLIHDGVRPLVNADTISRCIACVREKGNAVVGTAAAETIAMEQGEDGWNIVPRERCMLLRAPQCFFLQEILTLYERTEKEGLQDFVDSASILQHYGLPIAILNGPVENIKITTPLDYFLFRGILETLDNQEVFGF